MKAVNNYRIKIEEWQEMTDIACVPTKHRSYVVQKKYYTKKWYDYIIDKNKPEWYTQSCHEDLDSAIKAMRNQYYRENPTTSYYNF